MFNSWFKHEVGKNWFKNLEYSLWITLKRPPKRPNHVTSIINPLTPGSGDCNLQLISFKLVFGIDFCISCEIACRWIQQDLTDETWLVNVNIGSGNGLVPTGIKPLPEPMLTKFYDKMASLSHVVNWDLQVQVMHCCHRHVTIVTS